MTVSGGGAVADPSGSDAVLARFERLHPNLIDLGLERILRLLDALGRPQDAVPPVIHIAGTNGKGSVLALFKAILEADGQSAHCYTSPHLVRFHERIAPNGQPIDEADLIRVLEDCEAANGGEPITFFEITTAAAFLAFSRRPADVTLLEVGLGGRYDATNVIDRPALTVITPVDYDHQNFLGDTIEAIAGEKAGILKSGVFGVIGPQRDAARAVIEEAADRTGAPLVIRGQDYTIHEENGRMVYQDAHGLLDLPLPRLPGRHQIENAGIVIAGLRTLDWLGVSDAAIAQGLETVSWPGRLQRLVSGPFIEAFRAASADGADRGEVWLDGGHNPHGARAVAHTMADLDERLSRPLYLIVGMMIHKDAGAFFEAFSGLARHAVVIPIPGEANCQDPEDLARAAEGAGLAASTAESLTDAVQRVLQMAREDGDPVPRLLIAGSLYLAGTVLKDHA